MVSVSHKSTSCQYPMSALNNFVFSSLSIVCSRWISEQNPQLHKITFLAGSGHCDCSTGASDNSLVANGNNPKHMRQGSASCRQPMDMPRGPRVLWRFSDLGPYRASQNLWKSRALLCRQLVLPPRSAGTLPRVAGSQGVPGQGVDQTHHNARPAGGYGEHAPGYSRELHELDHSRVPVRLCCLQVLPSLVGPPQLRPLGGPRCGIGLHGGVAVPVPGYGAH